MELDQKLIDQIIIFQRDEITEHHIYRRLAAAIKSPENKKVLQRIVEDELRHYQKWQRYSQQDVTPYRWRAWWYYWISRVFGITFGIKLLERAEKSAEANYGHFQGQIPDLEAIIADENKHEAALIAMVDEERLQYVGSIVLGLNDALVELTGGLAGLTLALQNTQLIALSGLIMGIAAALSMGASEYLSTKAEKMGRKPLRSSIYTSAAYVVTVIALILPYLLIENHFICLACTLVVAVLIIALFNYYISVARDEPFRRPFMEMAGVSLGVAAFSFALGYLIRMFLGVEV